MSKKEFYETYIKDNRSEDEKMMDIIHENAKKEKNDKSIEKKENNRKKGVFERIIDILLVINTILLGLMVYKLWIG